MTAVEWLKNEMAKKIIISDKFEKSTLDLFIEALEMEKQQIEKMYSEEEVEVIAKDAYAMGRNNILIGVFNKWFEQFKKDKL
jgi:hypothetical protein